MNMKELKAFINKDNLHKVSNKRVMREIKNFTVKDAITPGNIVLIKNSDYRAPHHGIVFPGNWDQIRKFFTKKSIHGQIIITVRDENAISYWESSYFEKNFPKGESKVSEVLSVYSTNIDVSKLKTVKDCYDIYKEYNLQFII